MAEDPEKKDEEKFEFDSAGQALGYISLDQAGVLAIQTARGTTGEYGASTKTFPWPLRCPTGRIPKTMKTCTPSPVLPAPGRLFRPTGLGRRSLVLPVVICPGIYNFRGGRLVSADSGNSADQGQA